MKASGPSPPLPRVTGPERFASGRSGTSGHDGAMPAREWKQRAYRAFDRFVPTIPFRYLPPKQSVRMAFNVVLDREPDPEGGPDYTAQAGHGALTRHGVAEALAHSEEFRRRVPIRDVLLSMHVSRSEFVAGLPRAARILDLGGTHQGLPDGALVHLGYPYPFERLVVVDLPVEDRHEIYQGGSTGAPVLSELGPGRVRLPLHGGPRPLRGRLLRPRLQRPVD